MVKLPFCNNIIVEVGCARQVFSSRVLVLEPEFLAKKAWDILRLPYFTLKQDQTPDHSAELPDRSHIKQPRLSALVIDTTTSEHSRITTRVRSEREEAPSRGHGDI